MTTPTGPLLEADSLIVQQTTALATNDFVITDELGNERGRVDTGGSFLRRLALGSRSFTCVDSEGQCLWRLEDTVTLGRDRWEVADAEGAPLAHIVRQISLLRHKISVDVVDGVDLSLRGSVIDWDFTVARGEETIATIGRAWAGLARGALGHSRYEVTFTSATPRERSIVLALLVALDRMRAKDKS
ncbi:MAG: LURP-one-related family protein [Actinomycetaceae bacterium]|nr:LURP-one-related family protein [Actinomycetaceae bacterium]